MKINQKNKKMNVTIYQYFKIIFILIIVHISCIACSSDTTKIYICGVGFFNKLYIVKDGNTKKIKVRNEIININFSEDILKCKVYYKYGLFGRKKRIIVERSSKEYLFFTFYKESMFKKTCEAEWSEKPMYTE